MLKASTRSSSVGMRALHKVARSHMPQNLLPMMGAGGGRVFRFGSQASFSTYETKNAGSQKHSFSTQPQVNAPIDHASVLEVMSAQQMQTNATTIPWFMKNMPDSYFRQIPDEMRTQHLIAVSAMKTLSQGNNLALKIRSPEINGKTDITVMNTESQTGTLYEQMKEMEYPKDSHLSRVKVFQATDGDLSLNIYTFLNNESEGYGPPLEADTKYLFRGLDETGLMEQPGAEQDMKDYITKCTAEYVRNSDYQDFITQKALYEKVKGTDNTEILYQPTSQYRNAKISIASSNVRPEVLLKLTAGMLKLHNVDVVRAHLDQVRDPENDSQEARGYVTILRVFVGSEQMEKFSDEQLDLLLSTIKRAKWLDDETVNLGLVKVPTMGVQKAEVITALCSMLQGKLYKINHLAYASIGATIDLLASKKPWADIADAIAQLFLDKFAPSASGAGADGKVRSDLTQEQFDQRYADLTEKIGVLNAEAPRVLLKHLLEGVALTLRTNFYSKDRYALSLRLDPSVLVDSSKTMPYGVFFSHGRWFNGFHNRFRDIARGGLRIVSPPTTDQYHVESARIFDEVYGLSYAQQLKNKDIPEGGAKAVVLVNSSMIPEEFRYSNLRKSVRAFSDSILDLTVEDSVKNLVDYSEKRELLYFGPDENVVPTDIEWITSRAAQRGYPIPAAFMSSKSDAGFNHKEFGVTSEGVVVYLDVALRRTLGIDPNTTPWTLKLTGGPDGDVAGNLLKIAIKKYGKNVKVVGIADGFGVAEDPQGLDPDELLRLVDESLPITAFNTACLSPEGVMMKANTEEGMNRRNSMHFRVKSDAFVPAGGRPNTINSENVMQFFDEQGQPSSPLIVEGANIFITNDAREILYQQCGLPIVKDSSANKCGVITSSCEIAASMLLSKEEFMSMKSELVEDVIGLLHSRAEYEAELLFREYNNYPGNLPHFSQRISMAINRVTDAITAHLEGKGPGDEGFEELFPAIFETLPKRLNDFAGDRVRTHFPLAYQHAAIACVLATKLVYNEGINFVEAQPDLKLAQRAIDYYRETKKVESLLQDASLAALDPEARAKVTDLLKKGGARTALGVF